MTDLKSAIEEAQGWLSDALRIATEDEACDGWKALEETAAKIEAARKAVDLLLPLHPEIEAVVKDEWDRIGDGESPEAMGLGPRC